jgi:hypothetical protein
MDMAGYKTPESRKSLHKRVKALLIQWADENFDPSGDIGTFYDDADEEAGNRYQSEIEDDKTHKVAMAEARTHFYEFLKDASLATMIGDVFDDLDAPE